MNSDFIRARSDFVPRNAPDEILYLAMVVGECVIHEAGGTRVTRERRRPVSVPDTVRFLNAVRYNERNALALSTRLAQRRLIKEIAAQASGLFAK